MSHRDDRITPEQVEARLAALLGGEVSEAERGAEAARLKRALREQGEAGEWEILLDAAARPDGERALPVEAPAGYWKDFDERLQARIAERSDSTGPTSVSRWLQAAGAVAALFAFLVVGSVIRDRIGAPSEKPAELAQAVPRTELPAPDAPDAPEVDPESEPPGQVPEPDVSTESADLPSGDLDEAQPDEDWAVAAVDDFGESPWESAEEGDIDPGSGWFPSADRLNEAQQRDLLNWLREQNSEEAGARS